MMVKMAALAPMPRPRVRMLIATKLRFQAGCTERFFPSEPPCGKGSSGFIQEVSNLVGDFLVGRLSVEERAQPATDLAPQRHDLRLGLQQACDRRCAAVPIG